MPAALAAWIEVNRPVRQLSGGNQHKVVLANAWAPIRTC